MRSIEQAYLIGVDGVTEVWLVRHADVYATLDDFDDPGLSPRGREQARRLAERVRGVGVTAVYASPHRRALETAGRAVDAREEGSTLLTRLLAALALQDFDGLIRWAANATAAQVAALAPHVLNAAGEGEAVAKRAVDAAARELVGLARSLERRFPGREPVPVALAGGLFHRGSALLTAFQRLLNADMPRARLASEPVDPVLGALRLAREIPS